MSKHVTVLLNEAVDGLNIKPNGIYVDATLGGGGHSSLILSKLTTGHLYCFDQDDYAILKATSRLKAISDNFTIIKSNFVDLKNQLQKLNISKIDGIVYDLGVSSFQFDIPERGFSYRFDAFLDMRMNTDSELRCYDIVNTYDFKQLETIFYRYGEDPFSSKIANRIIKLREEQPIETTFQLVDAIKSALPNKVLNQKGHPAKKIFQALRIAVNDELRVFEDSIKDAIDMLNIDGRAVVITFHSLEDRICKTIFKEYSTIDIPKGLPIVVTEKAPLELITRKPILPSEEELDDNNRAHSAKMRIARKQI
ncbi:MAG: 16S rRNA (cytosine(1402)-N(4))-methyltransferase RsmH [bacterium]